MKTPAQKIPKKSAKAAPLEQAHTRRLVTAEPLRKITVNIPAYLLEDEQLGTTELIREALKEYRQVRAQRALLGMFGKVKWDIPYAQMKAERE